MTGAALAEVVAREMAAGLARVRPSIVGVRGRGPGGAAGVVWEPGDHVVTNYHVVAGRNPAPRVVTVDGRRLSARVVAASRELDLALLELPGAELRAAPVGDSTRLRVGELVLAVGHPWGQPWAVTAGIVSGVGGLRVPGRRRPAEYVRSDVRLAPGSSGGPLLDARAEVIGLCAMVVGGDLAVAIPSHVVRRWLADQGAEVSVAAGSDAT